METVEKDSLATSFNEARYGQTRGGATFIPDDRTALILSITEKLNRGVLVDVGCTDGSIASQFKSQGFYVIGLDASASAIEVARQRCDEAHVVDGNGELPVAEGRADVVWAGEVLEHIFYTEQFLEELKRVLKPGGHLVLSTPNLACWLNRIVLAFGLQPFFTEIGARYSNSGNPLRQKNQPAGHIRVFTASSLKWMVGSVGFEIVSQRGASIIENPKVKWLDRILSRFFPSLASDLIIVARRI